MNIQSRITTAEAEDYLEALADELEIPESRYEQAERSYKSLGDWLNRDNSSIRAFGPGVYSQGSFALGTVIAPISDAERYDIDAICEFKKLSKRDITQKELKGRLGLEVELYRQAQNMNKPAEEHRRCWRLEYADEALFHMDVTPDVPNAAEARAILTRYGADSAWAATAIAITDMESPTYSIISDDWLRSNPGRACRHGAAARLQGENAAAVVDHDSEAPSRYHVREATQGATDLDHCDHPSRPLLQRRGDNRRRALRHPERYARTHPPNRRRHVHHSQPYRSGGELRRQMGQASGARRGLLRVARPRAQ
jgi:hypothetical protein